jgi:hypothetical protein
MTQVTMGWNPGASSYRVYRDGSFVGTASYTGGPYVLFTMTLPCGTVFDLEVSAVVGGAESAQAHTQWHTNSCDGFIPPAPTNLHVTAVTATSVTLAWDPVIDASDYLTIGHGYNTYRAEYWGTAITISLGSVPCPWPISFEVYAEVHTPTGPLYVSQGAADITVTPPCT